jgi:hypothetical protein
MGYQNNEYLRGIETSVEQDLPTDIQQTRSLFIAVTFVISRSAAQGSPAIRGFHLTPYSDGSYDACWIRSRMQAALRNLAEFPFREAYGDLRSSFKNRCHSHCTNNSQNVELARNNYGLASTLALLAGMVDAIANSGSKRTILVRRAFTHVAGKRTRK